MIRPSESQIITTQVLVLLVACVLCAVAGYLCGLAARLAEVA